MHPRHCLRAADGIPCRSLFASAPSDISAVTSSAWARSDGAYLDPAASGAPSRDLSQGSGRLSFDSSSGASEPGGDAGSGASAAARKLPPASSLGSIDEGEERWGAHSLRGSLALPAPIPEAASGASDAERHQGGGALGRGGAGSDDDDDDDLASEASSEALALAAATELEQRDEDEALEAAAEAAEREGSPLPLHQRQRQHSGWGRLRALVPRKDRGDSSAAGVAGGSRSNSVTLPNAASLRAVFAAGHAGAPDQDGDGRCAPAGSVCPQLSVMPWRWILQC